MKIKITLSDPHPFDQSPDPPICPSLAISSRKDAEKKKCIVMKGYFVFIDWIVEHEKIIVVDNSSN